MAWFHRPSRWSTARFHAIWTSAAARRRKVRDRRRRRWNRLDRAGTLWTVFDLSLVDGLVATPAAEQAQTVGVVRLPPEGVARELEGAALDLSADLLGDGNAATHRGPRSVRVELRKRDGTVVGWTALQAIAAFVDEQRVVLRCLRHAAPRRWPVSLEFVGPQMILDSWDPAQPLGVAKDACDVERWLGEASRWGWHVERWPDRVRLQHHAAGGANDVMDEIADGFSELFGEKRRTSQAGTWAVLEVARTGLGLSIRRSAGMQPPPIAIPATQILALGAAPYGYHRVSEHADVTVFTPTDAVPLCLHMRASDPITHRSAAVALKYALASLLQT
jgi:hypothetical protein